MTRSRVGACLAFARRDRIFDAPRPAGHARTAPRAGQHFDSALRSAVESASDLFFPFDIDGEERTYRFLT